MMHTLSRNKKHTHEQTGNGTILLAIRDVHSHEESQVLISPSEIPELVTALMEAVHNYSMASEYIEDDDNDNDVDIDCGMVR